MTERQRRPQLKVRKGMTRDPKISWYKNGQFGVGNPDKSAYGVFITYFLLLYPWQINLFTQ